MGLWGWINTQVHADNHPSHIMFRGVGGFEHTNAYDHPLFEFNQIRDELGPNTFMQWVGVVFHTCSCIYPTLNKSSWGLVPTHNNVYWHPLWGLHGGCNLHTFVYLAPHWGWLSEVIHAHNLPHSAM